VGLDPPQLDARPGHPDPSPARAKQNAPARLSRWFNPAVFDFWARHLNRTWSAERVLARVVERRAASSRATTLVLKPNRHWPGAIAGQHLDVILDIEGVRHQRSYSLSAPPRADGCIEITVAEVEGGRVSPLLARGLKTGDVLELGAPYGGLRLAVAGSAPVLLLAAGSGITPLRALLLDALANGAARPITLLYWAQNRDELCFSDELQQLAQRYPNLRVEFLLTRDPQAPAARINAHQLRALAADLEASDVLACGPDGFIACARELSVTARGFQAEGFTAAAPRAAEAGTVRVQLQRSGLGLDLPTDRPLLQALEEAGQTPVFGCRRGICNTCSCDRLSGASRDLQSGALALEPATPIRLCVHSAAQGLVLDL
jgi:ferredoxin-NADP reductase